MKMWKLKYFSSAPVLAVFFDERTIDIIKCFLIICESSPSEICSNIYYIILGIYNFALHKFHGVIKIDNFWNDKIKN